VPEGDTIWKTAASLRRALAGRDLVAFDASVPLRRRPALGERWRAHPAAMRVAISTADVRAVCFAAPVVEVLTAAEVERHPRLSALGPDLTGPEPDLAAATARIGRLADAQIGAALLDQRVAAGIGNIYKSELLFACRVDPFAPVAALAPDTLAGLLSTAAALLRANAQRPGPRSTTPRGRLAIYGRAGLPCPRCDERIASARQGEQARVTYWCPRCQPATSTPAAM
jgi:endonuclease-8